MTRRQEKILKYIARHIRDPSYQLSISESMALFKVRSPNGVRYDPLSLEEQGIVSLTSREARWVEFDWKSYL